MNSPLPVTLSGALLDGERTLLALPEISLQPGEWCVLVGPSGIGKSSLLRVLAGLRTHCHWRGSIESADGQPLSGRVAFMTQHSALLPWSTVRENVSLGSRLRGVSVDRPLIDRLIDQVGLADHQFKRPGALSGGQRQRVALARTLAQGRPVVLLDEPFSALDAGTRAEMQQLALIHLADRAVVLVSHDPIEAARLASQIVLFDRHGHCHLKRPDDAMPRALDAPSCWALSQWLWDQLCGPPA